VIVPALDRVIPTELLCVPPVELPVNASVPVPETRMAEELVAEELPTTLPVQLRVPAVDRFTLAVVLLPLPDELAATLADDPTPRIGVVMHGVAVAP
jgi:hypothetical protein